MAQAKNGFSYVKKDMPGSLSLGSPLTCRHKCNKAETLPRRSSLPPLSEPRQALTANVWPSKVPPVLEVLAGVHCWPAQVISTGPLDGHLLFKDPSLVSLEPSFPRWPKPLPFPLFGLLNCKFPGRKLGSGKFCLKLLLVFSL